MDWLNRLKVAQETPPNTIKSFSIIPETELHKPQKAIDAEPKETISIYCADGDCHCSGMLPGRNHPADCLSHNCEYYHLAKHKTTEQPNEQRSILTPA